MLLTVNTVSVYSKSRKTTYSMCKAFVSTWLTGDKILRVKVFLNPVTHNSEMFDMIYWNIISRNISYMSLICGQLCIIHIEYQYLASEMMLGIVYNKQYCNSDMKSQFGHFYFVIYIFFISGVKWTCLAPLQFLTLRYP